MELEKLINEKIQRLQDLQREMQIINNQIGALQEKGRAFHQQALSIKGGLDALLDVKAKQEEEVKTSETAKLTLPVGVKPILPDAPAAEAPKAETPATPLEVVQ